MKAIRSRKLRMGMVGGGEGAFIGGVHRVAATLDHEIELVAGCFSRDSANTRRTGERLYLDAARCYATYEEMLARESALPADRRIDFVSIVTPNVSHFSIAEACLQHGFHVVCDKPMTYSLDEALRLVNIVSDSNLVFALSHNYTGHPLVRHARELFVSGQMGEVRKVIVEYLQDFLMVRHELLGQKQAEWRVDPAQAGIGGTLGDCGTHCVNLLEFITGDTVREVAADTSNFLPGRVLDEDVNALVRMSGGGKGVLAISQIATGEENGLTIRIYASKGAIKWAQENPNSLEVYRYGEPRQILTRGQGYLSDAAKDSTRIPTGHPEGYLEAFATIYRDFAEAIRRYADGEPMTADEYKFPTVYAGLRGMQFIYAAVASAQNRGAWTLLQT